MSTHLKRLLMRVSEITTVEELKANLDQLAAQCEQDYALAEQMNLDDKSELMAAVAHAKGVFTAMVQALAEREATQGFWRKWVLPTAPRALVLQCVRLKLWFASRSEKQKIRK